jgi:outer membrane protein TolC
MTWMRCQRALCLPLLSLSLALPTLAADDPEQLAAEALAANPSLEVRRERIAALASLAGAAGTWSDPVLGFEYSNVPVDSLALDEHPMSALQLQAQQTLPPWGWSRLREEAAESRTLASEHALTEAESQLRREVFALFWRLTLSRMLEGVTREHVARAEELLRAARARYETGSAGQHEILRLEVLRDRLRDDLGEFARNDRELGAALARTLSRPADAVFATPRQLEPTPVSGNPADWVALARDRRPELKRLEESVRTAEAAAELARVDAIPDLTLWLRYRVRTVDTALDSGTDQVAAGVSVPIPWGSWKRSRAEHGAQLASARGSRARHAAEFDRIESQLTAIHARWSRAFEQAAVYSTALTPSARAALETSLADYTVGRASFATLYEAEVDLLELEKTLLAAIVRTHIEAAAARAVIGSDPSGVTPQ